MKILIWGVSNTFGGVESFIYNSIIALKKADSDICIDCIGYYQPIVKELIENYKGNFFDIDNLNNEQINKFFCDNGSKYDIFWYNCVDLSHIEILKYARKYKMKKIIIHSHSSSIIVEGNIRKKYHYIRHCYHRKFVERYGTDYWACSDIAAKWLFPSKIYSKVKYIPNAINAEKFRFNEEKRKEIRKSMKWNNDIIVAQIGRISREKDPYFAIDVFKELKKLKKKYRMIFIGDGELKGHVQDYAKNSEVIESVDFLGKRSDVSELLQGIDIVIMSSDFEGFPMVAVEAQAAGTEVFVPEEAVTKQVGIVDACYFLKKSLGARKWAEQIDKSDTMKKDNYEVMCTKGFDTSTTGIKLISMFSK